MKLSGRPGWTPNEKTAMAASFSSPGARILMFHRVRPVEPVAFGLPDCYRMRGTSLTPDELVRVLDGSGPVLPLDAIERALAEGTAPPAGSVLTFDDGYREHLDVVAPLLADRGVTATFYVATGLHGRGDAVAVVDAWYWLLDHAETAIATVPLPGGGTFRGRLDTPGEKAEWVVGPPKAALLDASAAEQRAMLDALAADVRCDLPSDLAKRLYLHAGEWLALVSLGMRVGAHSVRHPRLTRVGDVELTEEMSLSVAEIVRISSRVPFAYPDGAFDDRVVAAARRADVTSAVTCEPGFVARGADPLRLSRWFVGPADVPDGAPADEREDNNLFDWSRGVCDE